MTQGKSWAATEVGWGLQGLLAVRERGDAEAVQHKGKHACGSRWGLGYRRLQ